MNHFSKKSLLACVVLVGVLIGFVIPWWLPKMGQVFRAADIESTETPTPAPARESTAARPAQTPPRPVNNWQALQPGQKAPDFTLPDRDERPVQLSSLAGKVVVINFWASWCIPCKIEMPDLQQLAIKHEKDGLIVLAVNSTYLDQKADALAFIDELQLTFPIVFDERGGVGEDLYSVLGLPTSFWVDREGIIRKIKVGAMTREYMEEQAEQLLAR